MFNYNLHVLNELAFSNKVEFHIVDFVCDKKIIDDLKILETKSQIKIHEVYDEKSRLMNVSRARILGLIRVYKYVLIISDRLLPQHLGLIYLTCLRIRTNTFHFQMSIC